MGEVDGELYIATPAGLLDPAQPRSSPGTISVDVAMKVLALRRQRARRRARPRRRPPRRQAGQRPRWTPAREVYLGDFGLARDPEGEALTAPGQVLGTIDYMAPELLDGERVGAATDIYGLACLAVETLTGTVPYPARH